MSQEKMKKIPDGIEELSPLLEDSPSDLCDDDLEKLKIAVFGKAARDSSDIEVTGASVDEDEECSYRLRAPLNPMCERIPWALLSSSLIEDLANDVDYTSFTDNEIETDASDEATGNRKGHIALLKRFIAEAHLFEFRDYSDLCILEAVNAIEEAALRFVPIGDDSSSKYLDFLKTIE